MENNNLIKGNSEEEIWQHISQQFVVNPDPLEYTATIEHGTHRVVLNIDIDLGGGFESGYETTSLTAAINSPTDFRFAIHREHFTDEIGKFFGMEDVVLEYEEFDKKLIIKTNEPGRLKEIFSAESTRGVLLELEDFTFGITTHDLGDSNIKRPFLELMIETGITEVNKLREIYHAFIEVLTALESGTA